ncbi:hypothetical protein DFJ73DRAFT_902335 [Zopfochytrium polystomum]|nr:hypothetical protein DFJ73DRAFT_902335 [Zopfochytrium polystomum]
MTVAEEGGSVPSVVDAAKPSSEVTTLTKSKASKVSSLPGKVISNIVDALRDHADHVSLLMLCKGWSKAVAESMYRAPPLFSSDSFERLMGLLNTPLPYHPYSAMIRELDISGMAADNLYMGDLDAALGMCPNLEVFRLEGCFHISNILVQSIALNCPNLLQLDLPGCPISDSFIPILTKKCRHLLRLDMSFTNATIASIHPVITNAESLLELDLSECRDSDDLTSLDLSNKGFRRPLKSLNLRNTPVTDDLLRYAVSQCPELEIVVLESCPKITDDAVIKLVNACTRLRSLDCSFCDRITDLSLNAMTVRGASSGGSALEELYLSACDLITPRAVQQMVQRNTRLCLLVLDGCEQIMGSFVQDYSTTRGDELECCLEVEQLRALANLRVEPAELLSTPPATPPRANTSTATVGGLKFEVTYATDSTSLRRKPNAGYAASAMAAAKEALANGNPFRRSTVIQDPEEYGGSPEGGVVRRRSSTLRHRRSQLGLSVRQDDADEETLEAARFERQEKIREKRRSRGSMRAPTLVGESDDATKASSALKQISGPLVAEPLDEEMAAKAAFLAKAAARGVKIGPPGSAPSDPPTNPFATSKRGSISSLKATVPEFIPQQQQQQPQGPGSLSSWVPPSANSAAARPASAAGTANPWSQQPASAWSAAGTPTPAPARRPSVGQPAGPGTSPASWTAPTGIAPSPLVGGAPAPVAAAPAAAPSVENPVLLFSGRASRASSRENLTQQTSPEPAAQTEEPSSTEEVAPVLIASGRRRTRGNSISEETRAAVAAVASSAAPASASSDAPGWQSSAPAGGSSPAPWGTDPTAWNNPAQLTSSSSTWSSTSVVSALQSVSVVPGIPGTPGFADPWSKAPGMAAIPPNSGSSILGPSAVINTADPWAAPPSASTSAVSTPVTQTAGFIAPTVLSPMQPVIPASSVAPPVNAAAAAQWGPAPSTPVSSTVPVPTPAASSSSRPASVAWSPTAGGAQTANGWTPSGGNPSPTPSAPGSPSRPPRPTSIASGRFGLVGAGAVPNPARTSWTPGMLASARNGSATAAAGEGKENGDADKDKEKGEFVFSNPNRGRMLLKLRIETKTGGHQALSVHELDDPQQLATEFVAFWDMHAFKEPLVRLITVRKNNVLRSRQH